METRFNQQKANLRSYLRKRGAEIDVRRQTIKVDVDSLNRKELGKLEELKKWGYKINEGKSPPPRIGHTSMQNLRTNRSSASPMRLWSSISDLKVVML